VIEVSGRGFPIRTLYRPPASCEDGALASPTEIADAVDEARGLLAREGPQDVLVFVPGEREIRAASQAIASSQRGCEVLPLFARLSSAEQDRVLAPSDTPRVIVATNVAETSLTLPAIGAVVDCGVARISRYDPQRRVGTLPIEPVSKASCDQRAGRCGRVAPGVCVRLYSESSYAARDALTTPEVLRTNLAGLVLRMRTLPAALLEAGCEASGLPVALMQPPSAASVDEAHVSLFELHALASPARDASVTSLGRAIARLPVEPRVARMVLAARQLGCVSEVLVLAAGLSVQDPRERPLGKQDEADRAHAVFRHPTSDFLTLLNLFDQFSHASREGRGDAFVGSGPTWCRNHFVSYARMREWSDLVHQLRDALAEVSDDDTQPDMQFDSLDIPRDEAIHRALLTGLIASVACREGEAGKGVYRTVRGEQARIFPGSVLFRAAPQWMMAAEVVQTSQLFARTCARIDVDMVREQAGHVFRTSLSDPHVGDGGVPSAWQRVTLGSIVVTPRERVALAQHDKALAREVLCTQVLAKPESVRALGDSGLASLPFMKANAQRLHDALRAQAKLRRKDVVRPERERGEFFLRRVPEHVCDEASLLRALASDATLAERLLLGEEDCLAPGAERALNSTLFPESIEVAPRVWASVHYAFAQGKDEDGITLCVPLLALPVLREEALAWLVPGMRGELFSALLKQTPKGVRSALERAMVQQGVHTLDELGRQLAELVEEQPSDGPSRTLASLARDVLGVDVAAEQLSVQGLPMHLRPRMRIEGEASEPGAVPVELACERDLATLATRLATKLAHAQRQRARATHDEAGIVQWGEWELAENAEALATHASTSDTLVLIDEGSSVRLTRGHAGLTLGGAHALTRLGIRRLLALACADELAHALDAMPGLDAMQKQYASLGSASELRDALALLTIDKALLLQRPLPRTRDEHAARCDEAQGRLLPAMREVCDSVGKTLEARARVVQRLASGTNRNWAQSVADMREHAAYLMPAGFLHALPWARLKDYARYATTLRERLFALREDGSGVERDALAIVQPRWKLLTAAIARAMAHERSRLEELAEQGHAQQNAQEHAGRAKDVLLRGQAPRHAAKRGAPVVNVDAGAWALRPEQSWRFDDARVALEELRAAAFSSGVAPARFATLVERADAALRVLKDAP
jgi:ATP-dependent helicase HrpA